MQALYLDSMSPPGGLKKSSTLCDVCEREGEENERVKGILIETECFYSELLGRVKRTIGDRSGG